MWIFDLLNGISDFLFDVWFLDRLAKRRSDKSTIFGDSPLEEELARKRKAFFYVFWAVCLFFSLVVPLFLSLAKGKKG